MSINIHGHILDALPECLTDDALTVESITDRVDELRSETDDLRDALKEAEAEHEAAGLGPFDPSPRDAARDALNAWIATGYSEQLALEALLSDLEGNGGDHQWEGNWYPQTLYAEGDTFTEAMKELVLECYDLKLPHFVHVDWDATADEMKGDYTETQIDETTYLYR